MLDSQHVVAAALGVQSYLSFDDDKTGLVLC